MSSGPRILLVDVDAAPLAVVAEALRSRGFDVLCAATVPAACEVARDGVDAVVTTRRMVEDVTSGLGLVDAMTLETPNLPPFVIWGDEWASSAADDLDGKLRALVPHVARATVTIRRTPLASGLGPVLVHVAAERQTGTLSVHTARASGEIRFVSGRVVDAVHGRVDGLKALGRMMDERDGTAVFVPGASDVLVTINRGVSELMESLATERSKVRELRRALALEAPDILLLAEGGVGLADEGSRAVVTRLREPVTLDALLDDLAIPDATILSVLVALSATGNLKRLGRASARAQVASVETLAEIKALVARLRAPGFSGPGRLVFATMHARIGVLTQAVSALADAVPPPAAPPLLPVPHVIGTVRLGDGVDLDLVVLPLVPAYSPLWGPALAGAGLLVQLDEAAASLLDDACRGLELPVVTSKELAAGDVGDLTPERFASLVRAALRAGAGA